MVEKLTIGVLGIQGAVTEHKNLMQQALFETKTPGKVVIVKGSDQINNINALIFPGGESTTISKEIIRNKLYNTILKRVNENHLPIMGTCAGCVLLASEVIDNKNHIKLLKLMDIKVTRNAFGRQKESFEIKIKIQGFEKPYNAVFIRAPIINKVWGKCKKIAEIDKKIIIARQNNLLALSFHPELTDDTRIHKYFLNLI
jgi:5'-phosphate synthase pdxT subunit